MSEGDLFLNKKGRRKKKTLTTHRLQARHNLNTTSPSHPRVVNGLDGKALHPPQDVRQATQEQQDADGRPDGAPLPPAQDEAQQEQRERPLGQGHGQERHRDANHLPQLGLGRVVCGEGGGVLAEAVLGGDLDEDGEEEEEDLFRGKRLEEEKKG